MIWSPLPHYLSGLSFPTIPHTPAPLDVVPNVRDSVYFLHLSMQRTQHHA